MDFNVQRQLDSLLLCTPDKRPPDYQLVPPHDILGRNDQAELELLDEWEQETFHPAGSKRLGRRM